MKKFKLYLCSSREKKIKIEKFIEKKYCEMNEIIRAKITLTNYIRKFVA